jgi:hypothetical protein
MRSSFSAIFLCLLTLSLLLSTLQLAVTPSNAQPTWSFRVEVLPAKLYMGEWNQLYANITNMDCDGRRNYILELKSASEEYVRGIAARAEEMRARGLIRNYALRVENLWGAGGRIYGDYPFGLEDEGPGL